MTVDYGLVMYKLMYKDIADYSINLYAVPESENIYVVSVLRGVEDLVMYEGSSYSAALEMYEKSISVVKEQVVDELLRGWGDTDDKENKV